jgi:hypothetical protein
MFPLSKATRASAGSAHRRHDVSVRIVISAYSPDIIAFAYQLVAKTPQTVANYLSHLGAVLPSPSRLGDTHSRPERDEGRLRSR